MDPLTVLFCWQFILFSLAIAGTTYPIRLMVEFFITSPRFLKFWTDVALPIMPTWFGAALAWLVPMFPFPDTISSTSARVFWGLVAGMFSSIMFRITKVILQNKIQAIIGTNPTSITSPSIAPLPIVAAPSSFVSQDPLGRARNPHEPSN
jgi:hypothetical protein